MLSLLSTVSVHLSLSVCLCLSEPHERDKGDGWSPSEQHEQQLWKQRLLQ